MTASSPLGVVSDPLDLTGVPLAELGALRDPALIQAIERTLEAARRGEPGDAVQEQFNVVRHED